MKAISEGNELRLEAFVLVEESRKEVWTRVFAIGEGRDAFINLSLENMTDCGVQAFAALLAVETLHVGSNSSCRSDQRANVLGVEFGWHDCLGERRGVSQRIKLPVDYRLFERERTHVLIPYGARCSPHPHTEWSGYWERSRPRGVPGGAIEACRLDVCTMDAVAKARRFVNMIVIGVASLPPRPCSHTHCAARRFEQHQKVIAGDVVSLTRSDEDV